MLLMKPACEACAAPLPLLAAAFICSYECTFCPACAARMQHTCPNCSGVLLARPTRVMAPERAD
ncbi:DUF1272 domain-containing protein [Nevskia sp.]|uniref:DUF1272 domain-containing protein n=1 Tax=Nevskia sp. TaxID=1929292 RepID=UPI0025EFFC66|nr:DUF1272 domain-containing protein [Nevskia sp.]